MCFPPAWWPGGRGLAGPPFPPSCVPFLFLFIIMVIISKPDLHQTFVWGVFKDRSLLLWEAGPGPVGFCPPQPPNRHPHLRHPKLLGRTQASDATSSVLDVPAESATMEASLVEEVP